jgi:16S rRNA (guanine527-N7)-methyltransferase
MPLSQSDREKFTAWAVESKINIDAASLSKIEKYYDTMVEWSSKINLVSHNDREHLVENHILDSLGALTMIPKSCRIIDIGSGAGFPGIPIAICRPDSYITLLESIHKRGQFLRTAIEAIGLTNTIVVEKRLEDLNPASNYDIATVRALPKRELMMPHIYKILSPSGRIILFVKRGQYSALENSLS